MDLFCLTKSSNRPARAEPSPKDLPKNLQLEKLEQGGTRLAELRQSTHQFVNDVAHELRTPLTVIKEFSSIIKDGLVGAVSATQQEYLGIVLDRVDDLSTMIENMQDMCRLEAGQLELRREECRIEDIVERLRPALERKAALRDIRLRFELADDLTAACCDPDKIGRVMVNLCMNAVKFSPDHGVIALRVENVPEAERVRITVNYQGPRISTESLKLLDVRFAQVHTNKSAIAGYGLSLNICKEFVRVHGGEIGVERDSRKGNSFWFSLPTT